MEEQMKRHEIVIRAAKAEDRASVLAVSAQIWDGDDYVPNVFDKWVADDTGEFSLISVDGAVAGFGKLTMLTPADAWLEGLRMGKSYRGLGLAKMLTDYFVQICTERAVQSLRLSTFIENHESLHIIETHGFHRIASFKLLTANYRETTVAQIAAERPVSLQEVRQAADCMMLAKRSQLLSFDFTFEPWRDALLRQLLAEDSIFVVRRDGRIVGLLILTDRHSKGNELSISYMQGETRADLEALTDIALATAKSREQNVILMCPVDQTLLDVYLSKGLRREYNSEQPDVFVYEHESTLRRA